MADGQVPRDTTRQLASQQHGQPVVNERIWIDTDHKKENTEFPVKNGTIRLSKGRDVNVQLTFDAILGEIGYVDNFINSGLIEGRKLKDVLYELKLYANTGVLLEPSIDVDISSSGEPVYRGGLSLNIGQLVGDYLNLIRNDRANLRLEGHVAINKEAPEGGQDRFVWVRGSYDLGDGWKVGGMSRRFTDKNPKNLWIYKQIAENTGLEFNYWDLPGRKGEYMMTLRANL